ncbi:MAG: hypothetical protein JWL77_1431 [Chthonomonadaceae bacterium]|nr:hypothetical protein [Chthonomonadaceae bacterium]
MSLHIKLLAPTQYVMLYGTTPPRSGSSDERILTAATKLAERVNRLVLDGLIVYDVQDESGRTGTPRPFPFLPALDPRLYARHLSDLTGQCVITYKSIGQMQEDEWRQWLGEARNEYGIRFLTPVGTPTSGVTLSPLPLSRAIELAADNRYDLMVGGIAIAERHTDARSESQRMVQKARNGCAFFISQAVYYAEPTQRLLKDYSLDCQKHEISPKRVVLTFAPCGRPQTMAFLKWLGIAIPVETEYRILSDATPLTRSIQICCANLRAILDQAAPWNIPLGVNVESVSIKKDEIDASIDLFCALQQALSEYDASVE